MSAALSFAFGAGLLATVNPCGFALLPSFLTFYLGAEEDTETSVAGRLGRGFLVGAVLSAAFGGVFIVAGLVVTAGLHAFLSVVPWIAAAIGAGLVALGLAMLTGRHVGLASAGRRRVDPNPGSGYGRVATFGVTYALASLSCTLAVFLVVVGQALATSNPLQVLAVFGAYAAGSASLLIALSMSTALAKGALARWMRRAAPYVGRVSGVLLVLSGAYLLAYWLPALGGGVAASSTPMARASEHVTSALTAFLSAHTTLFAALLAALLALGIGLLARRRSGNGHGDGDCCSPAGEDAPHASTLVAQQPSQ